MHKNTNIYSDDSSHLEGMKKDFIYGISAFLTVASAVGIYLLGAFLGTIRSANIIISILVIALAGVLIAQILKFSLTGKALTPGEVFQNAVISGLLAATSSSQAIFHPPATWAQVLMKSNFTAAIVFLIYFAINARNMVVKGKHLKALSSALIVGVPFLFGWLLLLSSQGLLRGIANSFSLGFISSYPLLLEITGRLVVVFVFNEIFVGAARAAIKKDIIRSSKAHLYLLFVSLAVVLSPYIANSGSGSYLAALPLFPQSLLAVALSAFSLAPLWGETYLLTGVILDGTQGTAPGEENIGGNISRGIRKGMVYSAIFMAVLYLIRLFLAADISQFLMAVVPLIIGTVGGALIYPFIKTVIETFDGSKPFFIRLRYSYRHWVLYLRGAVFGFGMAYGMKIGIFHQSMSDRIPFGLMIGLFSSVGISFVRDVIYSIRGQGRIQSWRLYFIDALLGAFVGSAVAFYLDSAQVPVVIEKFKDYTTAGFQARRYTTYPLLNKWGMIDLGIYTGGVKLFYTESFAGVLNWAVAAWLFAINRVFMEAYFKKDKSLISNLFSKEGVRELGKHLVRVMRWGLWMAPIIFTFLRMMPEPTWYNQDGLIRTFVAIFQRITLSSDSFAAWSLNVFLYILVYDFFRILIWVDHLGLRVATLVNWSFLGLDRLDKKISRFIGPAASQRYICEAVRRFATWAPLLIPFYMPSGEAWDYLWTSSQALHLTPMHQVIANYFGSFSLFQTFTFAIIGVTACTGVFSLVRVLRNKSRRKKKKGYEIKSGSYKICARDDGSIHSTLKRESYLKSQAETHIFKYDITRRSYDIIDPCGRSIFILDTSQKPASPSRFWPVIGNFPGDRFSESKVRKKAGALKIQNINNGIRTTVDIRPAAEKAHAEKWNIKIENLRKDSRHLKIVPYLEWVLNGPNDDRFHPQYSKLFPEIEYISDLNALLAWQKKTKLAGYMAADSPPEGFLNYRLDFVGRARSIWNPEALEKLDFMNPEDTSRYPTFDPIGSFLIDVKLEPESSGRITMVVGCASSMEEAIECVKKYMGKKEE